MLSLLLVITLNTQEPLLLLTIIALSLQISVIASNSYRFSLFGSAFQLLQFICVQKYRKDFKFSSLNKLLITCNIDSHNEIIEQIYFKYFITGSKVISVQCYCVIAITLCYIQRYRVTLYHSIAKLSFLIVIALGTQEPLSRLKVIALSKFEPLSLLKVIALRTWHKR